VLLAYRTLFLGDFLTGLPALRGLRDAFAAHELVLAVPPALRTLAALSGVADRIVATPELGVPNVRRPALAVDLHGNGPASRNAVRATGADCVLGYALPADRPGSGPAWIEGEHEVRRWCRLLAWWGIPADPDDLDLTLPTEVIARAPGVAENATVIHPGASAPARCWPAQDYAAVARSERARGHEVVITGTRAERPLARAIATAAGLDPAGVLAGRTPDPVDLAAVIAVCGRLVCGDTGPAHLATALRRPSVVVFGPTPPSQWGPPRDRPWHRVLWGGRSGDPHGRHVDDSLLEIAAADVAAALADLPDPPEHARTASSALDPRRNTTTMPMSTIPSGT
jgi:ADP-heptose:LPS heptosyltransferase